MVAACGDPVRHIAPDAPDMVDAPIDSPSGSASRGAELIEPSPKDHDLELGVLVMSVVVAAAPSGLRKRRKDAA